MSISENDWGIPSLMGGIVKFHPLEVHCLHGVECVIVMGHDLIVESFVESSRRFCQISREGYLPLFCSGT